MAIIVASREAATFFSPLYRNGRENAGGGGGGEKSGSVKKKSAYPVLISSPGRWTGNSIIFKGGPMQYEY